MHSTAIICIGKLKTAYWQAACAHYVRQLAHWRRIEIIELKDSKKEPASRPEEEGKRILAALLPADLPIALTEGGKRMTSPQFAHFLHDCDEITRARPVFIIGGPYGLSPGTLQRCPLHFSLSDLTWPHELARALLLEQLYRAESIIRNLPYHH